MIYYDYEVAQTVYAHAFNAYLRRIPLRPDQ
jgi:hypothetical protein